MKRSSPLRRVVPLKRKTPLRSRVRDSNELRKAKKVVKARARDRCEARIPDVCTYWGHDTHHIVRRSQGGTHSPENCVFACRSCHRYIHANVAWAKEHGLIKSRWDA